jgi:hypothetical protein
MTPLPIEITDDEAIARVIFPKFHLDRKGKVTQNAYRSPPDMDEISVMRSDWLGAHDCKALAKAKVENPAKDRVYAGFAVLSAKHVRSAGATVIDSRHVFVGHADIQHGVIQRKGVPLPPEIAERCKKLAAQANPYIDAAPQDAGWSLGPLRYK